MTTKTKSFTSTMPGAPVLSGSPGALIAVLDACLVNGFGLQTVTSASVAAGVCTLNVPAAPSAMAGSVVLVDGATNAAFNGEQRVLGVTANAITFATDQADGAVAGTLSVKLAPAGFAKAFAGTNLAAYQLVAVGSTGFYLRLDDTGTTVARVRGFEAMSDVDTGTGLFPNGSQIGEAGLYWSKSDAADSTARAWWVFADDRGVYVYTKPTNGHEFHSAYFGDILPIKQTDAYACVLRGMSDNWVSDTTAMGQSIEYQKHYFDYPGLHVARAASGIGGSAAMRNGMVFLPALNASVTEGLAGSFGMQYPSPVDSGLLLTSVAIFNATHVRGYYPGVYLSSQLVNSFFSSGDLVDGGGDMAGKSLRAIKVGSGTTSSQQGVAFFDTTSDWR